MNVIELKKKYERVFRVAIENKALTYRPFNAQEMILLLRPGNEDKYKDEITREAVFEKEAYDALEWASKEILYNKILEISVYNDKNKLVKKKLEIKEELENNPYLVLIKQIMRVLPTIKLSELLECNIDQLLFYIVLCEEFTGKGIIDTNPLSNNPVPTTSTQRRPNMKQEDLVNTGMDASSNDLMAKLSKHGATPKQFERKIKKDFAQE